MRKKEKIITMYFSTTAILGGCATPKLSDSLYRDSEVGFAKQPERCWVLAVREIKFRGNKDDNLGGLA